MRYQIHIINRSAVPDKQIRAMRQISGLPQHDCNSNYIIRPCAQRLLRQAVEIKFEWFGKFRRSQNQLLVAPGPDCCSGRELNCAWQNEAVVVIKMLADKVHSARSDKHARRHVEFLTEPLGQFVGVHSGNGIVM